MKAFKEGGINAQTEKAGEQRLKRSAALPSFALDSECNSATRSRLACVENMKTGLGLKLPCALQ